MKTKGFTLIEIIVSLAIFSVVAVIAIGALVRVTSANRQAQSIQSGVNNVNFVLDTMSREMRVGTNFVCNYGSGFIDPGSITLNSRGSLCSLNSSYTSPGDTIISFTSSTGLLYAYLFSGSGATTTVYKAEATAPGQDLLSIQFYPLTSQSVNITDYLVGIYGGSGTTYPYHIVFARMKGYVGVQIKDQSVFDVETTVSDRLQ